jgi:5-methylcytosine-specific restriction enzyme subunit McrC
MHSHSQPHTLLLTERRPRLVRLAPVDVAYLLEHHRGHLEVLPTGRRDCYRLTALGHVGVLAAPTCRFIIQPKIPLANIFAMLDPRAEVPQTQDDIAAHTGTETLELLVWQLSRRMAERVAAGLHRAYQERREQGTVLHGRLDLPEQLRQAAGRRDQLHGRIEELSADVPCNQAVRATAEKLLASSLLGAEIRAALRQALTGFEGVASVPLSPRLWERSEAERLSPEYRPLLDLCRVLADGLTLGNTAGPTSAPSFLLNLESVFEQHITRGIVEAFAGSPTHTVSVQVTHTVTAAVLGQPDVTMRPDLTIERDGRTVLVVDAKWKRWTGNAETGDLYQVLAYGTALGAEGAVLVYPGQRWRCQDHRFTHTPLRLMLCTLRVGGTRDGCLRCVRRLARALKKRSS